MSWRLLALVVQLGLGLLFFYIALTLLVDLVRTPQFQQLLVLTGIVVSGLAWVYSKLPDWLQRLLRAIWRWKSHEE